MTLLTTAFAQGTHAARPAASSSNNGFYYYETDTTNLFQSTGAAWQQIASTGGGGFSNPMTTKGDIIIEDATPAPARLAIGSTSQVLVVSSGLPAWAYPSGYEFDYVEITSPVTVTSTTDGTSGGTAIIDGNAVSYDGSTRICVEFYVPRWAINMATGAHSGYINLYDGTTDLGRIAQNTAINTGSNQSIPILVRRFLTPSNASHTFHIRGWKDASGDASVINCGAGGASTLMPAYYRVTKA